MNSMNSLRVGLISLLACTMLALTAAAGGPGLWRLHPDGPALGLLRGAGEPSACALDDQAGTVEKLFRGLWQGTGVRELLRQGGYHWTLGAGRLVMVAAGLLLLYLAVSHEMAPLILAPLGFAAVLANIPLAALSGPDGLLGMIYQAGVQTRVLPLLVLMCLGATTDLGPLIADPKTALLGVSGQIGIFTALFGALLLGTWMPGAGWGLGQVASIGIAGGGDALTGIYLSSQLAPELLGAIALAGYLYVALLPVILPPLARRLTTEEERGVRMAALRPVSRLERVCTPIVITLVCALLVPRAAPLIGMLMFGNLMRECGVVDRLSDTARHSLVNTLTIFLGLAVGSRLSADAFLNVATLGVLVVGFAALCLATVGGILLGKLMYRVSDGKVNPLAGAAGAPALPVAAYAVGRAAAETDPDNPLLVHAMGPNAAALIGSALAAGVLLNALQLLR